MRYVKEILLTGLALAVILMLLMTAVFLIVAYGFYERDPSPPYLGVWTGNVTYKDRRRAPYLCSGSFEIEVTKKIAEGIYRPCCTNRSRDSLHESSMIAGRHEQLGPYEV
jgi:hypothetical protein